MWANTLVIGTYTDMYKEGEKNYKNLPKWVSSTIKLGYEWDRERVPWKRRLTLISMPCMSVAASLIALGSIRKDLERESSNNIAGHFDALCRARDSYFANPEVENSTVINNQGKSWKFYASTGEYISVCDGAYKEKIRRKGKLIPNPNGPCETFITVGNAKEWRLKGEPVIENKQPETFLNLADYHVIPECEGEIQHENLHRSYTNMLLIGDGEGRDTSYMDGIYSVNFQKDDITVSLGKLLTIHPNKNGVRRMDFCNKQKIDSQTTGYQLVIADGVSAFLGAISHFKNSDVIGVFSRDEPLENIERISNRLGEIGKYYVELERDIPTEGLPHSMTTKFMEAR